jgi:hypothetical protein
MMGQRIMVEHPSRNAEWHFGGTFHLGHANVLNLENAKAINLRNVNDFILRKESQFVPATIANARSPARSSMA